jgi:hypothetical protein
VICHVERNRDFAHHQKPTVRDSSTTLGMTEARYCSFFAPRQNFFAVDCMRREDYRIVGKNRDGRFAKSFFAGKFGVSLFCDE